MKSKRICEILGFIMFPFFTYPIFLESSDFTGLSDYVVFDFLNNRLYCKIQVIRQPENTYNQTALVFSFLMFHRSFFLVVVRLNFALIPICGKLHCKRPCFAFRFAVFWNAFCRVLEYRLFQFA